MLKMLQSNTITHENLLALGPGSLDFLTKLISSVENEVRRKACQRLTSPRTNSIPKFAHEFNSKIPLINIKLVRTLCLILHLSEELMKKASSAAYQGILDECLVPFGLCLMIGYHLWLLFRIIKSPTNTVIGVNGINRRLWVQAMLEESSKNGILAVQTFRNTIMASTLLASTAIALSSVIAVLMTGRNGNSPYKYLYGDKSELGFSIKFFSILVCFLVSFLFNLQSIRYYSHASILINVPIKKLSSTSQHLMVEYITRCVNRGGYFWSLGLRAFYFSFPMFFWIFGPIPMSVCCVLLVVLLYFLDITFECASNIREEEEENYYEA